ncbi:hypothetical protein GCG54_00003857 [Colletotrichum gloeosporioides]|uniref:Heterokaryon incompatibility domain-containing protein n=1 Tax=Colletotrichum gloeosporioides TaxID=474922 RepID=A0A8H4FCX7_COLGL|nr:uncharacterized protein GCG54_00003857 [Colletotrichum gloeosporioides]KAF3797958.1 hypothetical protein GCG54_00003857 [Colletotrichum gloeosporioides]
MAESATAGCRMCGFIRDGLLQRNIGYKGEIFVNGGYLWGGQGDANDVSVTDPGLACWRCEAYKVEGGTRSTQLAVLNFDIETSNNDLLQWLRVDTKCAPEPLDPDTVQWLKSELRSCDDECDHVKPASQFLPTRLIDVGQREMDVPRLILTKDAFNLRTIDDLEGLDVDFESSRRKHIRGSYRLILSSTDLDEHAMGAPRPGPSLYVDLKRSSWDHRGWTFQELVLSPRMIVFGPSMCHFVCGTKTISENGHIATDAMHGPLRSVMNKALGKCVAETNLSAESVREAYWQWTSVNEAQSRIWTYREDIFPGLSGLAQGFATITGDTYLAGLWKNDLHHQLVWEISRPIAGDLASLVHSLQHADPYIAPSWSWASRTARYENLPDRQFSTSVAAQEATSAADEKDKTFFEVVTQPSHVRPEFALIDYRIDLQGSNTFGPLSGAFLRLRGKICRFPSDVKREALGPSGDCRPSYGKFSCGIGTCMLDWGVSETSVQGPESMQLFLISSCCSPTSQWGKMKWLADCDDVDYDTWVPSDAELGDTSFASSYESIDTCKYCADPMHRRPGWGLVIHPMEELGNYVRVGAFVLFAHKGGMDLFKTEPEEIILV